MTDFWATKEQNQYKNRQSSAFVEENQTVLNRKNKLEVLYPGSSRLLIDINEPFHKVDVHFLTNEQTYKIKCKLAKGL